MFILTRYLLPLMVFGAIGTVHAGEPVWRHLTTENGDLPLPGESVQQTAAIVHDFDQDRLNDFVIGARRAAPAVVGYRRTANGWDRFVIEPEMLPIEAGGAVHDIDGDGDSDLVFGGDARSNELWWWENPYPAFDSNAPWKRHVIKKGGANAHHDQAFGDFKGTGQPQLAFWNQRANKLFLADIPSAPREALSWPYVEIFDATQVATENKPEGMATFDVDGDGRLDLLAGMHWFKNTGGNDFKAIQVADRPGRIAAGKFKPGRYPQIVVAPGDVTGPIRLYECIGDPEEPSDWRGRDLLDREMVHGHTLEIADIDGDGNLDIFAAEMAKWGGDDEIQNPDATAWIWYGNGAGEFRRTVFQVGYDFHEGRVADLNGDGRLDVLSKPYTWEAPRIDIWLQEPSTSAGSAAANRGAFRRDSWYEPGVEHGNVGTRYNRRFRVNDAFVSHSPRFKDRPEVRGSGMMQILLEEDLTGLINPELYLELWGGHPGTAGHRITVNGRTTHSIPAAGVRDGHCMHLYPVIPLRSTDLVNGYNALQFACDPGSSFWGHFIVDNACVRTRLPRTHSSVRDSGLAGFSPTLRVERRPNEPEVYRVWLDGAAAYEAKIDAVLFDGFYFGYDENGDGLSLDWHGYTKKRKPEATLGIAHGSPYQIDWDTSMLPAQSGVAVRATVRFRSPSEMHYEVPAATGLVIEHGTAEVHIVPSFDLPEPFWSRASNEKACSITIDVEPERIERAELHVVTWTGGAGTVREYFRLNGHFFPVAEGNGHEVVYSVMPIDPAILQPGANQIILLSDTEHHGIEVLLPGPALVLRLRKS